MFLASKFGRTDKLTFEQEHDILICRVAHEYHYPLEYVKQLDMVTVGKLLSYLDGRNLIDRYG